MNRKHLLLRTIIFLLGAAALFTACSLGGDMDAWYEKAYEENYGYPPGKPESGSKSKIPSTLVSNASYSQAIDKLDEIIAYCYANPGNELILGEAEYARSQLIGVDPSYWPAMQAEVVAYINELISHLGAAPDTTITDMSPNIPYQDYLPAGATDQYRFYVNSGYNYTIAWYDSDSTSGSSYADIKVGIKQEGDTSYFITPGDGTSNGTNCSFTFTVTFTGYVIVGVTGFNSSSSGYYEIWYNESGGNSATEMSVDRTYKDTLSADATHQYRFYVTSGSSYTVDWRDQDTSSSYADIYVAIRQEGTSGIFARDSGGPIFFTATFTGYVIVQVTGDSNSSGYYEIWYNQLSGSGDGSVRVINEITYYTYNLSAGETHQYRFYVYNGRTYTVYWYDSDTILHYSYTDIKVGIKQEGYTSYLVTPGDGTTNGSNTPSRHSFTADFSGYVIVEVTGYNSDNSGSYDIWYYDESN